MCCSASSQVWERLGGNTNQLKEQGTAARSCQVASLAVLFHIYQSCGDCCWSRGDWERTLGDDDLMLESSIMSRTWKRIRMEVVVFLWDFLGKHVVKQSARANAGTEVPVYLFLLGEEKKKKKKGCVRDPELQFESLACWRCAGPRFLPALILGHT